MQLLQNCDNNLNEQFKLKCLTFYQKAVQESLTRFPIKDRFYSELQFLSPSNALNNTTFSNAIYTAVLTKFSHIINPDLALTESKQIYLYFNENERAEILKNKSDIVEFWSYMNKLKKFNDKLLFKNISRF